MEWRKRKKLLIEYSKVYTFGLVGYSSKPTFIVNGAQKSGTTALFHYLDSHPQIVKGLRKEPHYFDAQFYRGDRWYHSVFPLPHRLRPDKITYEATPLYLYDPKVPALMHKYNPNLKLITLLRNPIDRAFSSFNIPTWDKFGYATFDEMVDGELAKIAEKGAVYPGWKKADFLHRGLYAEQLERYFALFPRENILIFENGDLKDKPTETMGKITDFLGLRPFNWESVSYTPHNTGPKVEPMKPETREKLRKFFEPYNEQLYALLGVNYGWK